MSFQDDSIGTNNAIYVDFHDVAEWTGCENYRDGYAVVAYLPDMQLFIRHAFDTRELGLRTSFGHVDRGRYVVIQLRDGIVIDAKQIIARFACLDLKS